MDCYCNDANSCNDGCSQNRRVRTCRQAMMQNRQSVMGNLNRSYRNSTLTENTSNCRSAQTSSCCTSEKNECESRQKTNCGGNTCQQCSSSKCPHMTNALQATQERPVGMTYTPYQEFGCLYDWEKAFCQGTIFSDLDKPFLMTNCRQGGARI